MTDDRNFTTAFTVNQSPIAVFAAINAPRRWWSGAFEGNSAKLGDVGLKPTVECYDVCIDAWTSLIQGSLKQLIETGQTEPIERAEPAA